MEAVTRFARISACKKGPLATFASLDNPKEKHNQHAKKRQKTDCAVLCCAVVLYRSINHNLSFLGTRSSR